MQYFTDKQMEDKEKLFALVCLGGLSEGFDYSGAKAIMKYWANKRSELQYCGGYAEDVTEKRARELGF